VFFLFITVIPSAEGDTFFILGLLHLLQMMCKLSCGILFYTRKSTL